MSPIFPLVGRFTGSSSVIKQPVRSVWVGPGLLKADIRTGLAYAKVSVI
jgi:hypothetical protein